MTEPKHAFEIWTPKQAEAALGKNDVNRNLRKSKVEQYARDMLAGNWTVGSSICFDVTGKLVDGQHRLNAQVKADVKIKWLVVRDLPVESQENMDTGIQRSVSDVLTFGGEKNGQLLGSTAKMVYQIEKGTIQGARQPISGPEVLQTLEEHPDIRVSVDVGSWARQNMVTPMAPTALCAAHWLITQTAGVEEATDFLTRVAKLTGEHEGSPVLALSRRMNEIRRQSQRVGNRDMLALIIKAWNADAEEKKVNNLALYSKTGEFVLPKVKERKVPRAIKDDHEEDES